MVDFYKISYIYIYIFGARSSNCFTNYNNYNVLQQIIRTDLFFNFIIIKFIFDCLFMVYNGILRVTKQNYSKINKQSTQNYLPQTILEISDMLAA